MNKIIAKFFVLALLITALSSHVYAGHDSGQGKSQDDPNDPLYSVSVAPEPSAIWLFLAGTLMIAGYTRFKKARDS